MHLYETNVKIVAGFFNFFFQEDKKVIQNLEIDIYNVNKKNYHQ
jgi:hypothetical protein